MASKVTDVFRPRSQPAQMLYDSLCDAAEARGGFPAGVWIIRERQLMWSLACTYARENGLHEPTIEEVERAENRACGHIDYASKFARGVSDIVTGLEVQR